MRCGPLRISALVLMLLVACAQPAVAALSFCRMGGHAQRHCCCPKTAAPQTPTTPTVSRARCCQVAVARAPSSPPPAVRGPAVADGFAPVATASLDARLPLPSLPPSPRHATGCRHGPPPRIGTVLIRI